MLPAMRLAALLVLALSGTAAAERVGPPPEELPYEPLRDGVITGVGALAVLLTDTVFKEALAPEDCRWCEPPGFDAGARDALRWDDTHLAHQISNFTGFGAVPIAVGVLALANLRDHRRDELLVDVGIVAESVFLALDVNQLFKMSFGRERPWIHALPEADKALVDRPTENNLSFYSGHATLAFSVATSAGVVASRRGYRWAPAVWAVGMPLAAATAYLRVAADRHWLSDVSVGAVAGVAIGWAVPRFLHARRGPGDGRATVELVPTLRGAAVVGTF